MIKKLLLLSTLYFLVKPSLAEFTPPIIDSNAIRIECSKLLKDPRTLRFETKFFYSLLFLNDSTAYYNPQGTLHLFKITFDSVPKVQLIKDSPYNGHNFGRYLFQKDDELYSVGGSGLFNYTSSLLKFDFVANEWFISEVKNVPPNAKGILISWFYENKLFVAYNLNDKFSSKPVEVSFGYIEINTLIYHEISRSKSSRIKQNFLNFDSNLKVYISDKFEIFQWKLDDCSFYILDKENNTFLQYSFLVDRPCISGKSFVYTKDKTLFYRNEKGVVDSISIAEANTYSSIDLNNYFLIETLERKKMLAYIIIITGLLIALTASYYLFFKQPKIKAKLEDENNLLKSSLTKFKGKSLTRDQLDEILGISHLSADSMKTQRSKLLNELNKAGDFYVKRIRNKEDKRFFDYFIE